MFQLERHQIDSVLFFFLYIAHYKLIYSLVYMYNPHLRSLIYHFLFVNHPFL